MLNLSPYFVTLVCKYKDTERTETQTHWRPACAQVIVWYHYLTHLQQENNRYSICTEQISKAVQFIRANYWYKVLEVISTNRVLHSFRHRPSALLWIRVLPAWLHNGLTVQLETGWSNYFILPRAVKDCCAVGPVMFSRTLISDLVAPDEIHIDSEVED